MADTCLQSHPCSTLPVSPAPDSCCPKVVENCAVGAGRQVPGRASFSIWARGEDGGAQAAHLRADHPLPTPLALPGLGDQTPILSPHLPRAPASGGRTQGMGPGCFALRSQGKLAEQGLVGLGPPRGPLGAQRPSLLLRQRRSISIWPLNLPFRLWTFLECTLVAFFLLSFPSPSSVCPVTITLTSPPVLPIGGLASASSSLRFKRGACFRAVPM